MRMKVHEVRAVMWKADFLWNVSSVVTAVLLTMYYAASNYWHGLNKYCLQKQLSDYMALSTYMYNQAYTVQHKYTLP